MVVPLGQLVTVPAAVAVVGLPTVTVRVAVTGELPVTALLAME